MKNIPSKQEIEQRIGRLYNLLNQRDKDWDAVFIVDKISQYYFTGTMQDGLFVLRKDGAYAYFVRRSFDRAKVEGLIDNIFPMTSYRAVLEFLGSRIDNLYLDSSVATLAHLERMKKYFDIGQVLPVDSAVQYVRSIKSPYETELLKEAGRQHQFLLQTIVPSVLQAGMNEAELTAILYKEMIKLGYQGVARLARFQTELVVGQICFGDNSIYPTSFDGPGGMKGMSPVVPLVGERERTLKRGDIVFVDIGYGYNGYHSDSTQIYMFGAEPDAETAKIHNKCVAIEKQAAAMLKPGNIPEDIYTMVVGALDEDFKTNFMGYKDGCVKFLGHGVGLQIDEFPVIAKGFRTPLEKGMVIALEPKKSIEGIGIVGVEDTYIVSEEGGICITGGEREIMVV